MWWYRLGVNMGPRREGDKMVDDTHLRVELLYLAAGKAKDRGDMDSYWMLRIMADSLRDKQRASRRQTLIIGAAFIVVSLALAIVLVVVANRANCP